MKVVSCTLSGVLLTGLLLVGCSSSGDAPPDRPDKPVELMVTIKVPGMT